MRRNWDDVGRGSPSATCPSTAAQPTHRTKDAHVFLLASMIKQSNTLSLGRQAHDHIIKQHSSYANNTFLSNFLVEMYGCFGCIKDAGSVFDHIPKPNLHSWNILINVYSQNFSPLEASLVFGRMPFWDVVSWTSIIMAFSQHGYAKEALNLFFEMMLLGFVPNKVTFLCSIEACTSESSLVQGQDIHSAVMKYGYEKDAVMGTALVSLYGKCGCLPNAIKVFGSIIDRDIASWNAMIATLSRNGEYKEALDLFQRMQLEGTNPDYVSFVSILVACRSLDEGLDMHYAIVHLGLEQNLVVNNALINMYGKYDCLLDASSVFVKMPYRTTVSWNALITAFADNVHGKEALQIFCQMQMEGFMLDRVSFLGALSACITLATLDFGHRVHWILIEGGYGLDGAIGNTMIAMYGWCGSLDDAKHVFNKMSNLDIVTWNNMIGVYCHAGQGELALDLFYQMHREGFKPNQAALVCVLETCAALGAHEQGHMVHAYSVQMGIDKDVVVGNILLAMYGKCGNLQDAWGVHSRMHERDVISWTGIIAGFSFSGCSKEALDFFCKMQLEGLRPDKTTFLCILFALNHDGEVDKSKHLFVSIIRDYSIFDNKDHFLCMVDLLGRAGLLEEAESLIKKAPAESVAEAWLCLLGACKIHVDVERGARVADQILQTELSNPALHVMLSNLYAATGRWNEAAFIREVLKSGRRHKEQV